MAIELQIPIFSERIHRSGSGKNYIVCPAFPTVPWREAPNFVVANPREDRALEELTRILRKEFNRLAREMRHDSLIRWSFHPEHSGQKIPIEIFLRKQSFKGPIFVITYQSFDRRIVLIPKLPGLSFDIERGQRLEDRANEVLTKYFKQKEKQADSRLELDQYLSEGQARVLTIELTIRTRQKYQKEEPRGFALLGGGQEMSGAQELEKVGRCLNRQYPNRLERAILREEKVEAIHNHFGKTTDNSQPLVLIGESRVGKTAIIHEFLRRKINGKNKPIPEVWLLSPQRMISGMSYVGQWEERAHAIFREAKRRKHILLFEDLPGLFQAGKSRDSDLTIGHILKAYFEDGSLRILAESTPESWRKLREIDRGFTDFFRTLFIEETSEDDTLRILIRTIQELEDKNRGTYFRPDLIPAVMDLQNRFSRSRAFPGKAVEIIQQLTRKYSNRELDREDVYQHFQNKTGIQRQFLSQTYDLEAWQISNFFDDRIKGQPFAIEVLSQLVMRCVAQLNEPGRPMGALLFLGPTGVGKTESAKALAEYFFGSPERLVRFDMNEFVGPDASERLIGSSYRPRGLLTAAIRRQPYSVVLLDEIEKAHAGVFDLLLQLLGDGRLTDATGETADFCNCIVIMTSNLGARSARHQLGFAKDSKENEQVYREAAEKFFRPELFNRLDNIVPFRELSRDDIESLVALMSAKALSRAGLSETQLNIKIQPDVYARLAKMGFKPEFGARALRRSVEEFLIEPIALRLSELPTNQPAIVTCSCGPHGDLKFISKNLSAVNPSGFRFNTLPLDETEEFSLAVNDFLYRIEDDLETWREEDGGVIDPLDPVQMRYFSMREQIVAVRRMRDHLHSTVDIEIQHRREHPDKPSPHQTSQNCRYLANHEPREFLANFYQSTDSTQFLSKSIESAAPLDHISQVALDLLNRCNSIEQTVLCDPGDEQRYLINIVGPDRIALARHWQYAIKSWLNHSDLHQVKEFFFSDDTLISFDDHLGGDLSWKDYWDTAFLIAHGPALNGLLGHLAGTHLLVNEEGRNSFADLQIQLIPTEVENESEIIEWHRKIELEPSFEVSTIQSSETFAQVDLGSGFATFSTQHRVWNMINPHLPVVKELQEFCSIP